MKRRQAIQQMVVISAGVALLPACKPSNPYKAYARVPLDLPQRQLLEDFTTALLPPRPEVSLPEPATEFMLTVLNDCHGPEDIQKFTTGLTQLQEHIKDKYQTSFAKLSEAQRKEVFADVSKTEGPPEEMQHFYRTARRLAIEHFTSSEYFLTNVAHWKFAPGFYDGCTAV